MGPFYESSADTLNERLRAEAAALRRNRRIFRRIMFAYVSVAAVFILLRVFQALAWLQPHSAPLGPKAAATRSGSVRYAFSRTPPLGDQAASEAEAAAGTPGENVDRANPPIEWSRAWTEFPWGVAALVAVLGGGVFKATRGAMGRQKAAARALMQFESPAAAGPLAEALRIDDEDIRITAENALVRLLPQLRATDASLLDDEQHACLNRALLGRNVALSHAILKAWEQVGDERDEPAVQRLAEGSGSFRGDDALRSAAWACLPYLRANADRRRTESTLLRACGNSSDDGLLRAAHPTNATDDATLMRPV